MNACVVEGYEIPVGSRVYIAQTTPITWTTSSQTPSHSILTAICLHAMSTAIPVPYGLGTHTCLGSRWMEMQLAVNVLLIAHYFTLEVSPANYQLRFSPLPSMKPSKKLKFHIAKQKRELPV